MFHIHLEKMYILQLLDAVFKYVRSSWLIVLFKTFVSLFLLFHLPVLTVIEDY